MSFAGGAGWLASGLAPLCTLLFIQRGKMPIVQGVCTQCHLEVIVWPLIHVHRVMHRVGVAFLVTVATLQCRTPPMFIRRMFDDPSLCADLHWYPILLEQYR